MKGGKSCITFVCARGRTFFFLKVGGKGALKKGQGRDRRARGGLVLLFFLFMAYKNGPPKIDNSPLLTEGKKKLAKKPPKQPPLGNPTETHFFLFRVGVLNLSEVHPVFPGIAKGKTYRGGSYINLPGWLVGNWGGGGFCLPSPNKRFCGKILDFGEYRG